MVAEVAHTVAQDRRVEGHVDAGDEDERPLARRGLLRGGTEGLQAGDRAGDGVLQAGEVVVDDLEELAGPLGDAGDELTDVVGGEPHLVGSQGGQRVVGVAVLVTLDETVHGQAAAVDDLDDGFQGERPGVGGEGVVLTDGVTREVGPLVQGVGLAHLGDLGDTEGRHGDLGELGEEQDAVRVVEALAVDDDLGRVVAHDLQDGEAQLAAGVCVGTVPDLLRRRGGQVGVHAHSRGLDALSGEGVEGLRGGHDGGGHEDRVSADGGGDAADFAATRTVVDAGAFDGEFDRGAGQDRGEHRCGVLDDTARRGGGAVVGVAGGGDELADGGGPHAVDDDAGQAGEPGRGG